jgi:hypothetical protein
MFGEFSGGASSVGSGVLTLSGGAGHGLAAAVGFSAGATLSGSAGWGLLLGATSPVINSESRTSVATWSVPSGASGEAGDGLRNAWRMSWLDASKDQIGG